MSAVDSRPVPTRGRGSTRGGRGGFGRGGPRGGRRTANGASGDVAEAEESFEDQGELGEMKKKYSSELLMLKELFPHWTDTDLVFALEETGGDMSSTIDHITQGNVAQFAEVKSSKDRARSKAKEEAASLGAAHKSATDTRGGRGRGHLDSTRGGRTRGAERGRGGIRGGRGGHATTNGHAKDGAALSIPTTETSAYENTAAAETTNGVESEIAAPAVKESVPAAPETVTAPPAETAKSTLVSSGGPSWASMLKPKPPPVPVAVPTKPRAPVDATPSQSKPLPPTHTEPEQQPAPATAPAPEPPVENPLLAEANEPELPPPKLALTEQNVEHLPDESIPPATQTVASTTGSADPRLLTPLPEQQAAAAARPQLGGFATTANRLAAPSGRSASFQRRVLEQQEAVVMPGHNAIDRAAVQFGSMGLSGDGLDVDDEREDPETRQPHQHSPPSQPRTSLPPAPRQAATAPEAVATEAAPTPKQAPGLPPASAQNQQQAHDPSLNQHLGGQQQNQQYDPYGRYGQSQQDSAAHQQKPFDPFAQQIPPSQYDPYGNHHSHHTQQSQSGFGGLSAAQNDYSAYYSNDQSRGGYNYYSNSYAPQQDTRTQGQHDPTIGQQRSTSGFGSAQNDSAYGSQQGIQGQSRFGETSGSGNNTPNPLLGNQQSTNQQAQHQSQQQQQGGYANSAASGYPYGHPNYNSPYQQAYQNQFGYNHQAGGYGGGYPAKQGGMYGAPHGYGIGSQSHYDQYSSSPANTSGFGQSQNSMRSSSGMGSNLGGVDDYSRSSAQSTTHQQNNYDPFTRSTSGFGNQGAYGQQQQTATSNQDDALKAYNDTKGGPSPALGQQPGRPGSATNNTSSNTNQTGLPPPQSHQSGYGGAYAGFPQSGQYGGLGGLGHQQGAQGQQQSAYSNYGGGFNQTYGYGQSRGGWGQNYNQH